MTRRFTETHFCSRKHQFLVFRSRLYRSFIFRIKFTFFSVANWLLGLRLFWLATGYSSSSHVMVFARAPILKLTENLSFFSVPGYFYFYSWFLFTKLLWQKIARQIMAGFMKNCKITERYLIGYFFWLRNLLFSLAVFWYVNRAFSRFTCYFTMTRS